MQNKNTHKSYMCISLMSKSLFYFSPLPSSIPLLFLSHCLLVLVSHLQYHYCSFPIVYLCLYLIFNTTIVPFPLSTCVCISSLIPLLLLSHCLLVSQVIRFFLSGIKKINYLNNYSPPNLHVFFS
jgi:hypothetical protein